MKTDKVNLILAPESAEPVNIVLREGTALPLREPTVPHIAGVLDAPLRYLAQRHTYLHLPSCYLLVNREELTITLEVHETDPYAPKIEGSLEADPLLAKFNINTGSKRSVHELADFLKMHRRAFADPTVAMSLVHELKNFKAKINKAVEKLTDNRGNERDLREQTISSNIPEAFVLTLSIFKGLPPQSFAVEVYIDSDFNTTLVSPEVNDLIDVLRDKAFDGVLSEIATLCPTLLIIEQ